MSIARHFVAVLSGAALGLLATAIIKRNSDPIKLRGVEQNSLALTASRSELLVFRQELRARFEAYSKDHTRRNKLLLDEVIGAYMRADCEECLASLRSMNASALLIGDPFGGIAARVPLDDFAAILKLASESTDNTANDLIRKSFERKAQTDPRGAFAAINSVPNYLKEELTLKLARIWGKNKGKEAADAFLLYKGVFQWRLPFGEAVWGWAERDTDAAFDYLRSLGDSNTVQPDSMIDSFLRKLAFREPFEAARLLPTLDLSRGTAFLYIFNAMALKDPEKALKYVDAVPGSYAQNAAMNMIALSNVNRNPTFALQLASQLPLSDSSLGVIRRAAAGLSKASGAEAYGVAKQFLDPHQRAAAMQGVAEGVFKQEGIAGMEKIVQQGDLTGNTEWLGAVASAIVGMGRTLDEQPISLPWMQMSPTNKVALSQYVAAHWSNDQAADLRAKLQ